MRFETVQEIIPRFNWKNLFLFDLHIIQIYVKYRTQNNQPIFLKSLVQGTNVNNLLLLSFHSSPRYIYQVIFIPYKIIKILN